MSDRRPDPRIRRAPWAVLVVSAIGIVALLPTEAKCHNDRVSLVTTILSNLSSMDLRFRGWTWLPTALAARYADDRRANFDIYLPLWLARHYQLIVGRLHFAGVAFALERWALNGALATSAPSPRGSRAPSSAR